ncbi:unnamed protein product [Oppiella nova]|uniref:Uncharacterized protein n=1 Tax=Oppiella nova TaxID=334625 RepID=A0A7R9LWV3_9ACAR|nr:unnamed protein product [Oppiella nova]CAG2167801.1 unnamed protein product [Oppiella nova]
MKVLLVLVQVAWAFGLTGAALECPTLDELGECTCIPNTAKLYCGPKTTIFTDLQNEVTFDSIVLEGLENPATINLNKAKTKALTIKDSNLDDFAKIFTANIVEVLAKISLTNVHKDDNKTKILVNDILENIIDKLPLDPFGKYGEKDAIIKIYLDHDTIQCTWLAETSVAWIYDGNHPTASTNLIHVDCNNYQNRDLFQMQPDDFTDHPVTTPTPEPYTGPSTTPPTTPTPEPSQVDYQIDQGWQQITANNWPYMDNEDSINKQHTNFFFIKPNENGFEKVKADLLSDPKQIVKYPFWSYERNVVTVDIDKVTQVDYQYEDKTTGNNYGNISNQN